MLQLGQAIVRLDRFDWLGCRAGVGRALGWILAPLCSLLITIETVMAQGATIDRPLEFNIPVQPLDAALGRYGDATGREALYDTNVAIGRMSGEVRGLLTPDEALKKLLSGTGLSPRFVAENSFVLLPTPLGAVRNATQDVPLAHQRYYGVIQEDLLAALCRTPRARPGRYRLVALFWIGRTGKVERAQRIGSAGAIDVDHQIDATLDNITFRAPPPAGFAQPVLVLIVPQKPGAASDCDKIDVGVRGIGDVR
ncbi:MAG: STN domain-containing protein [Pseudomonadota bacterium]|jgi:hypothetical protein